MRSDADVVHVLCYGIDAVLDSCPPTLDSITMAFLARYVRAIGLARLGRNSVFGQKKAFLSTQVEPNRSPEIKATGVRSGTSLL